MGKDAEGITAEKTELIESGFFYRAKLIVLREINLEKRSKTESDEVAKALMRKREEMLKERSGE